MLKISFKFAEIFEFSRENSHFERIRMVRMVRSLADRTFQLCALLVVTMGGTGGSERLRPVSPRDQTSSSGSKPTCACACIDAGRLLLGLSQYGFGQTAGPNRLDQIYIFE